MSENQNVPSDPKDIEGATARIRTQSECSMASDDGNPSNIGKRQRTTSQTLMQASGLTSASPPKFVSLEEIMQAANSMKDMALVHKIVLEEDFRLEIKDPPPNTIHKTIKETMHKAFWDMLRSDFQEDPPNYEHALVLLDEIRVMLLDFLLPQHTKLRQQIVEVLDGDLIRQQAEKGVLDFRYYAEYTISVMSKLCAPVRDEKIKELREMVDVVETFRGILETLKLMALDMANFTIAVVKPDIIAQSVQFERKKFADFLAVQADGLQFTRQWLLKHLDTSMEIPVNVDRTTLIRNTTKDTVVRSALDLIDWDITQPYPETFMLDVERLQDLQVRTVRLIVTGTVLLIAMSNVGSDLNTLTTFKKSIKEHCSIIMDSYTLQSNLKDLLPNIAEQVIKDVKESQENHNFPVLNENGEKNLRDLILDVGNDSNRIRQLVKQRTKEFYLEIIGSSTANPQKFPTGLSALQKELTAVAGQFLKIISHNTTVFSMYYYDIVDNALPKAKVA